MPPNNNANHTSDGTGTQKDAEADNNDMAYGDTNEYYRKISAMWTTLSWRLAGAGMIWEGDADDMMTHELSGRRRAMPSND